MKLRFWLQIGLLMLLSTAGLQGQDHPVTNWKKIPIIPSTTPQCLVRADHHEPYETGFLPCPVIAALAHDYLRDHDIIIWTPPHYKIGPAGPRFWISSFVTIGLDIADEESAQRLIRSPGCQQVGSGCEFLNPILGKSRLQAYSVMSGILAFSIFESRKQRRYQVLREQVGLPQWKTFIYSWWGLDAEADGLDIAGITGSAWSLKHLKPRS
jgi:hypothetical protein